MKILRIKQHCVLINETNLRYTLVHMSVTWHIKLHNIAEELHCNCMRDGGTGSESCHAVSSCMQC